jgi:uncharacterized protein with GYD domain
MPIFITQGRYSQSAMQGMLKNPEDRKEAARQLFERAGGRLVDYYVTFGEYDFLVIAEAPDETAALSALAVVGASGGVTDLRTMLAVTTAQAKTAFEAGKKTASQYRAPGQQS